MRRQLVMRFNLDGFPAPTVPPTSWADYADFRIMPTSLLKVAIEAVDVARRSA